MLSRASVRSEHVALEGGHDVVTAWLDVSSAALPNKPLSPPE